MTKGFEVYANQTRDLRKDVVALLIFVESMGLTSEQAYGLLRLAAETLVEDSDVTAILRKKGTVQ